MNYVKSRIRYLLGAGPASSGPLVGSWFCGDDSAVCGGGGISLSTGSASSVAVRTTLHEVEYEGELLGGEVLQRDQTLPNRPVIGVDLSRSRKFSDKYVHLLSISKSDHSLNLNGTGYTLKRRF